MNLCRSPKSSIEFEKYYQLRYQVLRQPWDQPVGSERDDLEKDSIHKMIIDSQGDVLAVGRLEVVNESQGKIRFMAVSPSAQGQGLGQEIMHHLEAHARSLGIEEVELNAREVAVKFYHKQGYMNLGFAYQLFNDINHYKMVKSLLIQNSELPTINTNQTN